MTTWTTNRWDRVDIVDVISGPYRYVVRGFDEQGMAVLGSFDSLKAAQRRRDQANDRVINPWGPCTWRKVSRYANPEQK